MQDVIKIESKEHPKVALRVIPGHFATPNSHVNYYLDMTALKARQSEAAAVAAELSKQILATTVVDTIVCMDGCEIIGGYLAEELTKAGIYSMNSHKTMYIITPEFAASGQMLFRENLKPMVRGKNVLLLLASVTTGETIVRAVRALGYYGATISGISAIFSAANSIGGITINSLFSMADIPDYRKYEPENCSMCKEKKPIDAFANAFGYSIIQE
ncbi:MAG: orotate phosphoribosyltransferase [Lachnospiraceae bacterium]|nr:orotate phosphoribosyltransferase [Lachnospiraceae bacterium]